MTQRLTAAAAALQSHQEALEKKRQALQSVENELRANQEALREAQTRSFEAAQQLSRARNEITALDLQKEGNAVRLEKLSAEKVQLEEERTGLAGRLEQFSASVEAEILNAQSHRGTLEERQQRLREIQQQLNETTQQLDDLLAAAGRKTVAPQSCSNNCRPNTKVSAPARFPPSRPPPMCSVRWPTKSACRTNTSWRLKRPSATICNSS